VEQHFFYYLFYLQLLLLKIKKNPYYLTKRSLKKIISLYY